MSNSATKVAENLYFCNVSCGALGQGVFIVAPVFMIDEILEKYKNSTREQILQFSMITRHNPKVQDSNVCVCVCLMTVLPLYMHVRITYQPYIHSPPRRTKK